MRIAALLLTMAMLDGCSFGMKRVESDWDGSTEPDCSDDQAPVIADALGAGLSLAIAAGVGNESRSTAADVVVISGLVLALGYTISSIVGEAAYKECHNAKAEWRIGGAIASGVNRGGSRLSAEEEARRKTLKEKLDKEEEAQPAEAPVRPPPPPRGFFCASSPSNASVNFCVREKAECERTRDVSASALPDLSTCALTESAWCFEHRCFTAETSCNERRQRLVDAGEDPEECVEEM